MAVRKPSERGPGSNQHQDKPARPVSPDVRNRNNNRSRSARNGVGQLAERTPQEWVEESERLVRKQLRLSKDIDAVYAHMRSIEPMSDEYYDTLDKVEEMERDLEIANQEIYEASLHAEGLTPSDVATGLHGRLTQQYFVLDGALEAVDGAVDGSISADTLWSVEGELTATRRDVLYLNRQGILKGDHVNEFCDKVRLHAAQLRRINTNGNTADVSLVRSQLSAIKTSVGNLAQTAQNLSAPIR